MSLSRRQKTKARSVEREDISLWFEPAIVDVHFGEEYRLQAIP